MRQLLAVHVTPANEQEGAEVAELARQERWLRKFGQFIEWKSWGVSRS
ncbi:hypothetical protein B0G75_12973 [Paraburkholderia sp. BL18I3N2]|nr:hypothetical protein B0G75_12973 [Paraburkholderia sp. BL18I3N2]